MESPDRCDGVEALALRHFEVYRLALNELPPVWDGSRDG